MTVSTSFSLNSLISIFKLLDSSFSIGVARNWYLLNTSTILTFLKYNFPSWIFFDITFTTTQGNFTINVTRLWASNSADRFWSALECGHYTTDEFFWAVSGKYVQFGLSGNPDEDSQWSNVTFESDIPLFNNTYGFVSFYQDGLNTGTTIVVINIGNNTNFDALGMAPFGKISDTDMKVVESLYTGYGTNPDQNMILSQGNPYLQSNFPKLDVNKGVTPSVSCSKGTKYCDYDPTNPFAIQCCTSGENCIAGVGCRC